MNLLQSLRWSGLPVALAACWSTLALGAESFAPPASSTPAAAPDRGVVSPDPTGADVCRKPAGDHSLCGRSRIDAKAGKKCLAQYEGMCSGCNVHPEPPFGGSYHSTMRAQIAKGEAALMVLHQFDFVPGEAALNYRGRLRLQRIAQLVLQNPFPIIIEAGRHDPALDAARRAGVVSELARMPFPVPAERVVVGQSPSRGLDGIDAEIIHENLLKLKGYKFKDETVETVETVK